MVKCERVGTRWEIRKKINNSPSRKKGKGKIAPWCVKSRNTGKDKKAVDINRRCWRGEGRNQSMEEGGERHSFCSSSGKLCGVRARMQIWVTWIDRSLSYEADRWSALHGGMLTSAFAPFVLLACVLCLPMGYCGAGGRMVCVLLALQRTSK